MTGLISPVSASLSSKKRSNVSSRGWLPVNCGATNAAEPACWVGGFQLLVFATEYSLGLNQHSTAVPVSGVRVALATLVGLVSAMGSRPRQALVGDLERLGGGRGRARVERRARPLDRERAGERPLPHVGLAGAEQPHDDLGARGLRLAGQEPAEQRIL